MGRRKIFTKREYERLSRSHAGRLRIYKKYLSVSILTIIGGIIFVLAYKYMYVENLSWIGILFSIGGGIASVIFLFMIQSEKEDGEEQTKHDSTREVKTGEVKTTKPRDEIIESKNEINRIENIDKIQKSNIEQIDEMSGFEFESYVGELLSTLGYKSSATKKSGDFGVDIILEKDGKKIIVQTKRHSKKVSIGAIQEISTAQNFYGIYNAWVVTNNYFTQSAIKLAESNHIKLVNRDELISLILKSKEAIKEVEPENIGRQSVKSERLTYRRELEEINNFSNKVFVSQNRVVGFFNDLDCEKIYNEALYVSHFPIYNKQNYIPIHFFYIEAAKYLHRLSGQVQNADDYALLVCKMDFNILKEISDIMTEPYACPTATIACIILERSKDYQKVIEYCDFFVSVHANEESGRSFIFRKDRQQKKLDRIKSKS